MQQLLHPSGPSIAVDTTLTAQDEQDIEETYGLQVADVQENVAINGSAITGTSKYVAEATTFDMSKGHNFIVLHFTSEGADTIKVGMNPTQGSGLVRLDESGVIVLQMKADKSQTVKVEATKNGVKTTKEYSISGMTFNAE